MAMLLAMKQQHRDIGWAEQNVKSTDLLQHPHPCSARRPARRTWTWRLASAMAAVSAGTVSGRLRAISSDATRVSVLSSVSAPVFTCYRNARFELKARLTY